MNRDQAETLAEALLAPQREALRERAERRAAKAGRWWRVPELARLRPGDRTEAERRARAAVMRHPGWWLGKAAMVLLVLALAWVAGGFAADDTQGLPPAGLSWALLPVGVWAIGANPLVRPIWRAELRRAIQAIEAERRGA